YLEEVNEPIYFHEFVAQAAAKGLKYLGEADASALTADDLPPDVNQVLVRLSGDWLQQQQYLDFLRGRQFRESLLCHAAVALAGAARPARLHRLHFASPAQSLTPASDHLSSLDETFVGPQMGSLTTSYPIVKAALRHLAAVWPGSVPFDELEAAAHARVQPRGGDPMQRAIDRDLLASTLLKSYRTIDLVDLR